MTLTLDESYARCRALNRRHGTTYYWSTYLLPRPKRRHVHALYGFCRYADDIVDELGPAPVDRLGPAPFDGRAAPVDGRAAALAEFGSRFFADIERGWSDDPVLQAVVHTVRAFDIDAGCFRRFLRSMEMDLTVATYETFEDLLVYTDGSAAVIGEMMLPILEAASPGAVGPARDLGHAFQLTNFLRDIAEDAVRGRVYVPQEDIRKFGASDAWEARRVTPAFADLMRYEIGRARKMYASASSGLALLPPASARCIAAAGTLYGGILDEIEKARFDVWGTRVRVPTWRKVAVAARGARPARVRRKDRRMPETPGGV